ncbi:hypothetical protein PAHAL_7G280500 [Panicum hallii]|uniref:Uncharacterized protein n=1 Tax=Panicum hallii TaxID=206008 RepID=A0A2S3IAK6_9POAL|nr:hypothetical protein PAHAL_7G280500 [Panicum hallii]
MFKTLEDDSAPRSRREQDGHRRKGDSQMEADADEWSAQASWVICKTGRRSDTGGLVSGQPLAVDPGTHPPPAASWALALVCFSLDVLRGGPDDQPWSWTRVDDPAPFASSLRARAGLEAPPPARRVVVPTTKVPNTRASGRAPSPSTPRRYGGRTVHRRVAAAVPGASLLRPRAGRAGRDLPLRGRARRLCCCDVQPVAGDARLEARRAGTCSSTRTPTATPAPCSCNTWATAGSACSTAERARTTTRATRAAASAWWR